MGTTSRFATAAAWTLIFAVAPSSTGCSDSRPSGSPLPDASSPDTPSLDASSPDASSPDASLPDSAPTDSMVPGDSGGSMVTAGTGGAAGASVSVPAGALARGVTLTVSVGDDATNLPEGLAPAGPTIVFGPEGQTFSAAVTVTIPTTGDAIGMYTQPVGGTAWTEVPGATYDAARRVVIGQTTHFSRFVPVTRVVIPHLTALTVTPALRSLPLGTTDPLLLQFTATGTTVLGTRPVVTTAVSWTSSRTEVATVSPGLTAGHTAAGGLVTLQGTVGFTTITATDASGAFMGTAILTVTPAPLRSLTVTPANAFVATGAPGHFTAHGTFLDGTMHDLGSLTTDPVVTWSSNSLLFPITNPRSGVVNSTRDGFATITATVGELSATATINATPFHRPRGFDGIVRAIIKAPGNSGDIYVGGIFRNYDGTPRSGIIRLHSNGAEEPSFVVGAGLDNVTALLATTDGSEDIFVGGTNHALYNGVTVPNAIMRLHPNGTVEPMFSLGAGTGFDDGQVNTLALAPGFPDAIYVGGDFTHYNRAPCANIIRLLRGGAADGNFHVTPGFDDMSTTPSVSALAPVPGTLSDMYVGGLFEHYNGMSARGVVRLNGSGAMDRTFNLDRAFPLSTGCCQILSLLPRPDGELYLGGIFTRATLPGGGDSTEGILRVTSTGLMAIGFNVGSGIFSGSVESLVHDTSDGVIAGGRFSGFDARGTSPGGWLMISDLVHISAGGVADTSFRAGTGFSGDAVHVVLPVMDGSGDVYVGGSFTSPGQNIVRLSPAGVIR